MYIVKEFPTFVVKLFVSLSLLLGLFVSSPTSVRAAIAVNCGPLPALIGPIVNVSTVAALQNAVENAAPNTTILIADGVYDLTNTLNFRAVGNVMLRGASGNRDAVVLRGRGMTNADYGNVPHVIAIFDASDVAIADLTLRDAYFHLIQVHGENGAIRPRFHNLHLIDAGEQFIKASLGAPSGPFAAFGTVDCSLFEYTDRARSAYTNAVDVVGGIGWAIRDNTFKNIRAPQGQLAGPAVLLWRNSIDSIVERNVFIECDRAVALGLSAPDGSGRWGSLTYDHDGGIVRNNTIYRSGPGDVGITVNYARDYQVLHNTVVLNGTFPWAIEYRFSSSYGTIAYNLTDGPIFQRDNAVGTMLGNVTNAQAGWFADASQGNLHLTTSAAGAIDQASSLAAVDDDLDGDARPVGLWPDVGADEYKAPVPTRVVDLRLLSPEVGPGTLSGTLVWTPIAGATGYVLKGATEPITEANWNSHGEIAPEYPGDIGTSPMILGYSGGTAYLAMKYRKPDGTLSEISNLVIWPHLDVFLPLLRR